MREMDEIFRRKLQHRSEPTPTHLWKGIEKELGQTASKRRLLPYITTIVGVGAVLIASLAWWSYTSSNLSLVESRIGQDKVYTANSHSNADPASTTTSNLGAESGASQSGMPSLTDTDQGLPAIAQQSVSLASTSSQANTTSTAKTGSLFSTSGSIASRSSDLDQGAQPAADSQAGGLLTGAEVTAVLYHESTGVESADREHDHAAVINGRDREELALGQRGSATSDQQIKWIIEQTDNVTVNTISAPQIMKSKIFDRRRELYRAPEELASAYGLSQLHLADRKLDHLQDRIAAMYTECPTFSTDHSGMFVDVYMSHDMPMRSLSAKAEQDGSLALVREETESIDYSFGIGGRVSIRLPSGFSLRTGLHYARINETLAYMDEGGQDRTVDNAHHFFDLPLLMGYDFGKERSRLYYSVNGGIFLNISYNQEGQILDPSMMPVAVQDAAPEERSAFGDNAGVSLYVSGAVFYRLLEGIDLYAEPYLRHMPGSLTTEAYQLDQRYTIVGIQTGLRLRF